MTRGDHIYVGVAGDIRHGIDVGDGRVIHYGDEPVGSNAQASIRYVMLQEFAQGGEIMVRDHAEIYGPEEVVARAESRLSEGGDDLLGRHGEHFASWCVSERYIGSDSNGGAAAGGLGTTATGAAATGGV